jgi:hypothetical protein
MHVSIELNRDTRRNEQNSCHLSTKKRDPTSVVRNLNVVGGAYPQPPPTISAKLSSYHLSIIK